jgi:hypothetical protein
VGLDFGRIRRGELIAASGGIVLLATLFFVPWFELRRPAGGLAPSRGASVSLDGWQALTTARWILLVTIAVSLGLLVLTAARRAPAVPVALGMVSCVLGGLSTLVLLYRIIDHPGVSARAGVYVGLVAAAVIAYGGYLSLRIEGGSFIDPRTIETLPVGGTPLGSAGRTDSTSAGQPGP